MILRLDPRLPLVWRSPSSVQLGIDPAVVILDDVTGTDERMLAALVVGVSDSGLAMIAGAHTVERDALLAALSPALLTVPVVPIAATVAVHGTESLVATIASTLAHSGIDVVTGPDAAALAQHSPALAILAAHYVFPPELHALWLRRDVPHLPILVTDTAVVVGPVVEPGSGPCLLCLELHRRDRDPAWPAIATQLLGRHSRAETPVLVAEGAAAACRLALERLAPNGITPAAGDAASVRIDAQSGRREVRGWHAHPECGCRGIAHLMGREQGLSPAQPGTDWASAARSAPAAERRTS
ncbi:MAG: TOMM precursor leader peptide-binding protein [Salinibacterium sp.]|nr:TOMM precursor leader peptide-binding protein [Salinibacterium sp.]